VDPDRLAPTTYRDAEALLQRLPRHAADKVWAELSQVDVEALLRSLAPSVDPAAAEVREVRSSPLPGSPPLDDSAVSAVLPRLAEATLLKVLETAPDAFVVIDVRGIIVLVNARAENIFGYARSEMLGQKVEMLVPARHRAGHVQKRCGYFLSPHIRAMGSGLPLFGVRKDGREFPVEISLSPLETETGLLVTSTIRDVTETRVREALLRKAEARYRSLVEDIPAVTFMAALDEGINEVYVSPQIVDLLGFTQEEWLNDPVLWHRQLHPEDRERWHLEFSRTCATAEPFRSVYRFLARDGRVVWVLGEAKVVRDEDGRPMFMQGVAFDITRIKDAEEELKQLNRTLEHRVADRTEALKRSNDALARFSHHVAHEMKKPLRRIFDVLNPPGGTSAKDSPKKSLQSIQRIAADMADLIGAMLAYAQVSEEAKRFVPTDCTALLKEIRLELKNEITASGAVVTLGPLPTVNAHRESLKNVFRNLLDNAIKYRANRHLKVRVTAVLEQNQWHFSVRDNGMGIPKHNRYTPHVDNWEKVFELFHRESAKNQHGDKIAGHGIGLSYCQRVVEHHGGKIWVESEPGKGSTFHFTLPAIPPTEHDDRNPSSASNCITSSSGSEPAPPSSRAAP
jgi:PAS domain S-box-containing protein